MRGNQMPDWLDSLITKESHEISKKAQDDKVKELEKKIQNAKTPEELDAIEKELQELEKSAGNNEKSDEASTDSAGAEPAQDDANAKPEQAEGQAADAGGDAGVMKELQDIKKQVVDKNDEIQGKLLNEIEKLNDQLGLNKIIDLNTTMNTM